MGKKLSEVVTLPSHATDDRDILREVGTAFKAAYMATVALDESDDAVGALEEYANKVDRLSENRDENNRILDYAITTVDSFVALSDALLALVPHAVLDCSSGGARQAERWCDDNCVGTVDFHEVNNACIVVFSDIGDCTLFKVKFGS